MADVHANKTPTSSNTTSATRIDITGPLYLHTTENASSTILPTVFDGSGYRSWRRAVLRGLSVNNKI